MPRKSKETHNGIRWRQCYSIDDFSMLEKILNYLRSRSRATAIRHALGEEVKRIEGQSKKAGPKKASEVLHSIQNFRNRTISGDLPSDSVVQWSFWAYPETFADIEKIQNHWELKHKAEAVRLAIQMTASQLAPNS